MRTADEYLESLRARDRKFWVDGECVVDAVSHPKVRPSIAAIAAACALAHDPRTRELATAQSNFVDARVNQGQEIQTPSVDGKTR